MYLDHAATTPMHPEVWEAMRPFATDLWGNPSGTHAAARRAKNAVEEARERAAAILGAHADEIVFTSGGTESDNLALKGAAFAEGGPHDVVTTSIEHEAVLEPAEWLERMGVKVRYAEPDPDGVVPAEEILSLVDASTGLVSVMAANNETGVSQPVAEVARAVRTDWPGTAVHTDAVQAFPTERLDVDALGVDLLSLSAHKFGGPKGVGLLYVRRGTPLAPVNHGGGQELGRRSGTLNPMGIVGMVTAMGITEADRGRHRRRVEAERDAFEARLAALVPGLVVTGKEVTRLPGHSHVRLPGVEQQIALIKLDRVDIAASGGSACSSGAIGASHVLLAMGLDATEARTALRFSFGSTTKPGDGAAAAEAVAETVA
jgi:cysteine desulfurase